MSSHPVHPSVEQSLYFSGTLNLGALDCTFLHFSYFCHVSHCPSLLCSFSAAYNFLFVRPLPDTSTHLPFRLYALLVTSSSLIYVRALIWTPALTKRFLLTLVTPPAPLSIPDPPPPVYLKGHCFGFYTSQQMSFLTRSDRDCDMQHIVKHHKARCFLLNAHIIPFVATMKSPRQLDKKKKHIRHQLIENVWGLLFKKRSLCCLLSACCTEVIDSSYLSEQSTVQ